ncbi:uncharacterized protein LOC121770577 isoform X1 [Salvia splendens]|uniref:uncharacterized protein LOC121770577 isoform X1 n=1 Tax=Salvia splendens TaxID=180675 RepID=UPI001104399A|nr:uncharacterized protein LOC121770577 isoform X1 [Salvia splendens]
MGKKLDALLGRSFKATKFKGTASLAVSRLAVLKNQRRARCSVARSDVVQFLTNNTHDRALLRVEQVIKEQNMLDVFVVLEGYCHLLVERVSLFEHNKLVIGFLSDDDDNPHAFTLTSISISLYGRFCPEELLEAVSTLIFASTRCGDFPELQELRSIFTLRFGREFAARAVELRNNCGVNPKVIQKLSTRMPSLENKMKVLKEIALENSIELPTSETPVEASVSSSEEKAEDERESGSLRGKYKDVADAAQAAFESAAYAAAAARIAVELSRSESGDPATPKEQITGTELKSKNIVRRSFSGSSSDSEGGVIEGNEVFDEREMASDGKGENGSRNEGGVEPLDISRRPISVRTTWARAR